MKKKFFLLCAFLILVTVGCNDSGEPEPKEPVRKLEGTKWKLGGFFDATTNELQKEKVSIIEFYPIGAMRDTSKKYIIGGVGINRVIGIYDVNYTISTIQFADLQITLLPPITEDDKFYLAALGMVNKFEVKDIELKLYYNDGKNYLLYYELTT